MTTQPDELVTVLQRTRELLVGGWTKHIYNRRKNGQTLYCLAGAKIAACAQLDTDVDDRMRLHVLLTQSLPEEAHGNMTKYNDAQASVEPVLAVVDRAIELAKEPRT